MLRSGRGKQLVTLVLNTAEGTEENEINKENQSDDRQQVKIINQIEECETATLMVLEGDSLKTQQILIQKSINIQNENPILPEDLELISHNGESFSSLDLEPVLDSDFNASLNTFQVNSSFDHYDTMLDDVCRDMTVDETSTYVLTGNESQDAGTSTSAQENVQCEVPKANAQCRDENSDHPDSSNPSTSTTVQLHVTVDDPNNHNMDEGRKRKRIAEPDQWKRNVNKKLRMEGKPYFGFTRESDKIIQNKPKQGRRMKETCKSEVCKKSKYRHCDKFTEEQRKGIFEHFWSIDWKERKAFVCAQVTQITKKKNTVSNEESRRGSTLEYRLNNGCQEGNLQVCREMFLNTLGIGYRMMQLWVKKSTFSIPNPTISDPNHRTSRRASNLERITSLKLFFDLLPKMPSHYARQNSSKLYLEPMFSSKNDVYKLYKVHAEEKGFEVFSFKKFCEVF